MNKFNWWRRGHKSQQKLKPNQALKGKSLLLQQIEHGDFDPSPYKALADKELVLRDKLKHTITLNWKGGQDSLKEKLDSVDLAAQKRYNKLYEEYDKQEQRMLQELKHRLLAEFEVDVWDLSLSYPSDLTTVQFYHVYNQHANDSHLSTVKANTITKSQST